MFEYNIRAVRPGVDKPEELYNYNLLGGWCSLIEVCVWIKRYRRNRTQSSNCNVNLFYIVKRRKE